jgi:hypothetical protein
MSNHSWEKLRSMKITLLILKKKKDSTLTLSSLLSVRLSIGKNQPVQDGVEFVTGKSAESS